MNKVTAVYFSPTGGTEKGTLSIARALDPLAAALDLTLPGWAGRREFDAHELVVFGAPVYSGRLPSVAANRLSLLRGNSTPCVVTVTYGNRDYDDALLELFHLASAHGFVPIAAAALVARHTYGEIQIDRPNGEDEAQNALFAKEVLQKLGHKKTTPPAIEGNYPYREGGASLFHPRTSDACTSCGLCARECPVGAIDPANPSHIDAARCLSCFRCIRVCPTHAKNMNTPAYRVFAATFTQKLSQRRENEYLL